MDNNMDISGDNGRTKNENLSQTDSETIWSVGDSCRAKWSGDDRYYTGVIKKLHHHKLGRVSALIKFIDYDSDECEEVDVQQLLKISRALDKQWQDAEPEAGDDRESPVSGVFRPLTGSEEAVRLEEKYGHESNSEDSSDDDAWISTSYQTKGKVSQWKISNPAKSQSPMSQRRKAAVVSGGSPRKKGRTSKKTGPQSDGTKSPSEKASTTAWNKSCNRTPKNSQTSSETEDTDILSPAAKEASVADNTRDKRTALSRTPVGADEDFFPSTTLCDHETYQQHCEKRSRTRDGDRTENQTRNAFRNSTDEFGGFGDDDMEKPKFSFAAPSAKVPFCLDEENKVQVPATLNQYLRDYQREGIRFMYSHYKWGRGAILGDDMGLGKTVQVIGFLSALLGKDGNRMDVMRQKPRFIRMMSDTPGLAQDSKRCLPFLIISPGSVLYNWLEELDTWGHFTVRKYHGADKATCLTDLARGKVEVVITTFETFRDNVEALNAVDWEAIIVDEVHRIKGMKAQTTCALRSTPCVCRFGLTGTPLQNNMSELWCILDWAQPGVLGSAEDFEEEIVKPVERGQRHDATKRELAEARCKKEAFGKVRKDMMLRRTKKLIADQLPQKTDRVVFCRLSPLQTSVYKAVLSHPDVVSILNMNNPCPCGSGASQGKCCYKKTSSGKKPVSIMFTFLHILLKTANHVALLIPSVRTSPEQQKHAGDLCKIAFKDHPEFISLTQEAAFRTLSDPQYCGKMKVLRGMLSVFAKSHSKVLVFSYSTRLLDILEQHVISEGHEYRRIDGKVTGRRRQEIVHEFNADPNIILCLLSTKAGGLGLNMTGANKVVIFDPNWNPSHDLQAQDRAYRIGQRRDVAVFRLVSAGTIEENIYLRQIYKQQLDHVAVATENARRYFHGIQDDAGNQGELFGVKNMFQLRTGDSCLTMDILHRNAKVEAGIAGYDMADYIPSKEEQEAVRGETSFEEDADTSKDDDTSDEESFYGLKNLLASELGDMASPKKSTKSKPEELPEEPVPSTSGKSTRRDVPNVRKWRHGSTLLDGPSDEQPSPRKQRSPAGHGSKSSGSNVSPKAKKTAAVTPSFSSVSSVFEECGVIHIHDNPQVVGGSRMEDHMSRCAMREVFELKTNTQAPALLCDPMSQPSEVEEEKRKTASRKGKVARGRSLTKDHNSSRTVEHDRTCILIGQTPAAIRRKHWSHLKESQSCQDDVALAQRIMKATPADRLAMLRDLYKKQHSGDGLDGVLDDILTIPKDLSAADDKGSSAGNASRSGGRRGSGKASVKKRKGATHTQSKRTPVKRKHTARGLIYCDSDDTHHSQSPRKRPAYHSDSQDSSDLDIGAKVSPGKVKGTPLQQRSGSRQTGQSQHSVIASESRVKRDNVKSNLLSAVAQNSVTSASRRILDFDRGSDTDDDVQQGAEDVDVLLKELGGKQNTHADTNRAKVSGKSANQSGSPGTRTAGRIADKNPESYRSRPEEELSFLDEIFISSSPAKRKPPGASGAQTAGKMTDKNPKGFRRLEEELSFLDEIFIDTSPLKRKPAPKCMHKQPATTRREEIKVTISPKTESQHTSTTDDKKSSETAKSDQSLDLFSDFMNNSTLQDDGIDCFGDSGLRKKKH